MQKIDYIHHLMFKTDLRDLKRYQLYPLLNKCLNQNFKKTIALMFFIRSPVFGRGERKIGRWCFEWLSSYQPKLFLKILPLIPEIGRWDDLLYVLTPKTESFVYQMILVQLETDMQNMMLGRPISNCAKWMPTEGKKFFKNNPVEFSIFIKHLRMNKPYYRTVIHSLRKYLQITEHMICEKKPDNIDTDRIPKTAFYRYFHKFNNSQKTRFFTKREWKDFGIDLSLSDVRVIAESTTTQFDKNVKTHAGLISPEAIHTSELNFREYIKDMLMQNDIPTTTVILTDTPFRGTFFYKRIFNLPGIKPPNIIVWNVSTHSVALSRINDAIYVSGHCQTLVEYMIKEWGLGISFEEAFFSFSCFSPIFKALGATDFQMNKLI